jgi:uncharacterized membrane protein YfbV (UPF0208 family)
VTTSITVTVPADNDRLTLVVAQPGSTRLRGFRLALDKNVAAALREACGTTVREISVRSEVTYAADVSYDVATQYLAVPAALLATPEPLPAGTDARQPAGHRDATTVETDPEARAILNAGSSLELLGATELRKRAFRFYAAIVGNDPNNRTSFVSRWNPYRASFAGRILTVYGEQLHRVTQPLLVFEPTFDMIVTSEGIAVLDKDAFEQIFRDITTMRNRVPVWTKQVVESLPLTEESAEMIRQASGKARVAQRLRALFEGGTLAGRKLSVSQLRDEMTNQGLAVERMIQGQQLVLTEDDVPTILKLLDEGYWKGWLTDVAWEAGSKSKRQS